MKKRVVVFGIFDGIHDGHRSLFTQARLRSIESSGGQAKDKDIELIVIIGRDSASLRWKGKKPKHSEEERRKLVLRERNVGQAVLGDEEQSNYRVLEELQPDVICLGYDQDALGKDVKHWLAARGKGIPLIQLQPFEPSVYHNAYRV